MDIAHADHAKITKPTFQSRWCSPTGTKVMDVLHGVALLAVLATAIWNTVLTAQGNATVSAMKPIFITTLIAAILKVPSQLCAAHGRVGGWLTVVGSIVTVIITAILIGYLTFDVKYRNDGLEDVCIVDSSNTLWHTQLDTSRLNNKGAAGACGKVILKMNNGCGLGDVQTTLAAPQSGGSIPAKSLYIASFNPALWSPVFHV
jgi:hypothetical protein